MCICLTLSLFFYYTLLIGNKANYDKTIVVLIKVIYNINDYTQERKRKKNNLNYNYFYIKDIWRNYSHIKDIYSKFSRQTIIFDIIEKLEKNYLETNHRNFD